LDAFYQIQAAHQISPSDIQSIDVETFGRALTLNNEAEPKSLESAQYSIPFCLGVAGWLGPSAFLPLDEHVLSDPRIIALSRKVRLWKDISLDKMFSAAIPARVRVRMANDCFTHEVLSPKGEPANSMNWHDIDTKFSAVAAGRLIAPAQAQLREAISSLAIGNTDPLLTALDMPAFAGGDASATWDAVLSANTVLDLALGQTPKLGSMHSDLPD
jgi:2-methylcitrate dehydratase PrpD